METSPMFDFILIQWILGKVTETKLQSYVAKGIITRDEYNIIFVTPRDGVIPLSTKTELAE